MEHLTKATDLNPSDPLMWIELAQLEQQEKSVSSLEKALEHYQRAEGLQQKMMQPVKMELWSNIGVLYFQLKKFAQAGDAFMKSLDISCGNAEVAKAEASGEDIQAKNVTTCFNLARLRETCGRADQASDIYHGILGKYPKYTDGNGPCVWLAILT